MAQFHFVEDYISHVDRLIKKHPIDEAMSLAVGGHYEVIGKICADLLKHFGLTSGMSVLDFGCGSGRTAVALIDSDLGRYVGIDVVPRLIEYADAKTPKHFEFQCNNALTIPHPEESFDMVCAYSVFTHLLQAEIFLYMQEMKRTLKPGGVLVFSFLELSEPSHWHVFEHTIASTQASTLPVLNMFVERSQIDVWASHIGFEIISYVGGQEQISETGALGQSCVALRSVETA